MAEVARSANNHGRPTEETAMSDTPGATKIQELGKPEAARAEEEPALAEELRCLRALLEEGNVEGARRLIADMAPRWPESAEVQHFARVLASPKARWVPGKRGRPMDKDYAWLHEHAKEHHGEWVAIYEGRLIAADRELAVVRARLQQSPEAEGALIHRIPNLGDEG
jgi:hypothetical protein